MPVNTLIQLRRGTAAEWIAAPGTIGNGILYNGEIGYETDTGKFKIGDGTTAWSSLDYAAVLADDFVGESGIYTTVSGSGSIVTIGVSGIEPSQVINLDSYVENLISTSSGALNVEGVQDIIGLSGIAAGFGIDKDYNDGTGFTTISVTGMALRVDESTGIGVSVSSENNNNVYTVSVTGIEHTLINDWTEAVQDTIGTGAGSTGFLVNGTGVAWTYDDNANTLALAVTGIPHTLITDWDDAIASDIDTALVAGTGITLIYNSGTNELTIATTGLDNSHTHVWANITDASTKATLTELGYLSGVVPGTASADRVLVLDSSKDIAGINNLSTDGNLTVGGDLTVAGTTTTVNSTVVEIGDNIIRVNTSGLSTGGFEVYTGTVYNHLIWNNSNDRWEFSGGDVYTSGTVIADCIEVSCTGLVNNLNADKLDNQEGSYYLDWNNFTNKPDPIISVVLSGDVTGSGSYTWTDLSGNPTININTSVMGGDIELGTDTSGQYASTISVAGTGLTATTPNVDDGTAYTITSNATPACGTGTIVSRDTTDGGFCAGTITASGFIGDGSQITNINADNIDSGTVDVARLPLASTVATGIAVFDSGDFAVSVGGNVTIKTSGIGNTQLENDSVTFGITEVELGSSSNRIDHLVAISGASAASPTVLTFCSIDGGSP